MGKKSTADKALQQASKALTHNKMDIFRALVLDVHDRGEDLNRPLDPVNSTLLHRASAAGNLEAVRVLVESCGLSTEPRQSDGKTPLHEACNHGHLEVATWLIRSGGAAACAHKTNGWSPLMYASAVGALPIVQLLLEVAVEGINDRNREGATALALASREGHADVVRALVHAGADVNVRTLSGKTALSLAAMRGHAPVCRVLFEEAGGLETGGVDVTGASLWHDAAASGCVEMIQILREKVSSSWCDTEDRARGHHPLHVAAANGHAAFVLALVERGLAKPDQLDKDGAPPLYYAAAKGHTHAIQALLQAGADPNVRGPHLPRSSLHCAVGWGHLEATRLLLQAKADVQCKDKDGATPLDLARRSGNAPLAALVEAVAAQKASVS